MTSLVSRMLLISPQHVSKQSKVNDVEVMKEPFEKTATNKIRRFKYKDAHGDDYLQEHPEEAEGDKDKKEEDGTAEK